MKSTEFTESKYLNAKTAGSLNGKTLTIFDVKAEMIGVDDNLTRKMVIGFEGVEKGCIANRTNNETLTEAFGDETNEWIGKAVILRLVNQTFKGKRMLGIQLEPVTRQKPGIQTDATPGYDPDIPATDCGTDAVATTQTAEDTTAATGKKKARK